MTDWTKVLRAIAPRANPQIIAMIADHADQQFAKWKINTVRRQACIITHAYVETQGFTRLDENLNYSAERMTEVWSNRFPTIASAQPYAHNPRALANKVYGSRMGNRAGTDDGWNNRGKGLWHCTGHDNCEALSKKLRVSTAQASAWLIDPDHALECACALFWILDVAPSADSGNVTAQTHCVNGGENGLDERKKIYPKVMRALNAEAKAGYAGRLEEKRGAVDPDAVLTAADLRQAGSRTMAGTTQVKQGVIGTVATIAGSGALEAVNNVASQTSDAVQTAQGVASSVHAVHDAAPGVLGWLHDYWPHLLIGANVILAVACVVAVWRIMHGVGRIERAKVEDTNDALASAGDEIEDDSEAEDQTDAPVPQPIPPPPGQRH